MPADKLARLLRASAAHHRHLCPRQVLGVRMSLRAGELLGLAVPQTGKRLLTIVETDGCAADGVAAGAGCWVGRRTLRVQDYGKVAATYVDTHNGAAVRLVPRAGVRERAAAYAPGARSAWHAQLVGYQRMPAEELLEAQPVRLRVPVARLLSRPGCRALCAACGEEILNEREVVVDGCVLCAACAFGAYFETTKAPMAQVAEVGPAENLFFERRARAIEHQP
jgi:formylmethanofuran dehydrogenase subunit E